MNRHISPAKTITEAIAARNEESQWESFIMSVLKRLQLSPQERVEAISAYEVLARQIADKLGISHEDVHVVVQGSMRTETTIPQAGNRKFDLDIVVKLLSSRFQSPSLDPHRFFETFGSSLRDLGEHVGTPEAKRRCWRLPYPGSPFYFDVTPAIPGSYTITGTNLRVRDPLTLWSPSNPEEFADWFCGIASMRFAFHEERIRKMIEAKTQIDPMPDQVVAIDDILRRLVQIIKLHRDNFYRGASDERKQAMPISVILVTLAANAFQRVWTASQHTATSAIEVVFDTLELMPQFIGKANGYEVKNPKLPSENFADRWNLDGGERATEFYSWHEQLVSDLQTMFMEEYQAKSESRIRRVFGDLGVDAWKGLSKPTSVLGGLLATQPSKTGTAPTRVVPVGSRNTLA